MSRISDLAGVVEPPGAAEGAGRVELAPDTRLFIPAHPRYPADPAETPGVGFEFLTDPATGSPVPVAFTTLEALVAALGASQPWIALPAGPFAELMRRNGFGRLKVDPVIEPGGTPHWTPDAVRAYAEAAEQ